jgi:simple sugar transport system permease protein
MKIFFRYVFEVFLSLIAVFLFTTFILLISGAPPFSAYFHIIKGSLGSWIKLSRVLQVWIPLTFCSAGLLYTFRINLWNIGVEGQIMLGAVFTTAVLRIGAAKSMPVLFMGLSFLAGIFGGAIWAIIAGVLKTKGNVNEIFAGLGLNFVGQGVVLWLIFGPWRRPGVASMSGTELFPQELWLPLSPALRLSPYGLILVLTTLVLTALLLRYTHMGLNLKAIGSNRDASFLSGLKPDRYMIIAMMFAGGFAGLAGSIQVAGVYHRLLPAISSNYGYLALLVVMLANYNVWITPLVAFFFACLNVGSIQLPMMLELDSSLSGVIQGSLVLATLAVYSWRIHGKTSKGYPEA